MRHGKESKQERQKEQANTSLSSCYLCVFPPCFLDNKLKVKPHEQFVQTETGDEKVQSNKKKKNPKEVSDKKSWEPHPLAKTEPLELSLWLDCVTCCTCNSTAKWETSRLMLSLPRAGELPVNFSLPLYAERAFVNQTLDPT